MRPQKIRIFVALAFTLLSSNSWSAEKAWLTDLEAAKKLATEQQKDLYLNFTGSDW